MHTTSQQFQLELHLLALDSLLSKGIISRIEYESDRLQLAQSLAQSITSSLTSGNVRTEVITEVISDLKTFEEGGIQALDNLLALACSPPQVSSQEVL